MRGQRRNNVTIVAPKPASVTLPEHIEDLAERGKIDANMRRAALEAINDHALNFERYEAAMSRVSRADERVISYIIAGRHDLMGFGRIETGFRNDQRCVNYAVQRLRTSLKNLHDVYNGRKRAHETGMSLDGYKVRNG